MDSRDQESAKHFAAIAICVITACTLLLRVYLAAPDHGSTLGGVSYLSQFFTILTNTLVMVAMGYIGSGRRIRHTIMVPLIVSISAVGVLYHVLLAHLWSPQGLAMIADQGVHTVVPVLSLLWWIRFGDLRPVRWRDSLLCIVWPLTYCAIALLRAQVSGFYPYPFLDLPELGWLGLVKSVAGLVAGFFVLGLLIVGIARARSRSLSAPPV